MYYFVGMDLSGTTFWEFKDPLNPVRPRRMAQQTRRKHYADIQTSPAWHQWLRHTRFDAPSLEEQKADVQRQLQLKHLAQLADERWASKASYLDAPKDTAQTAPITAGPENLQKANRGAPSEKWQPGSWEPGVMKR